MGHGLTGIRSLAIAAADLLRIGLVLQRQERAQLKAKRETVSQASLQAALAPVLASDAVLLSDGGRAYPGCARRLGVQHEAVNL